MDGKQVGVLVPTTILAFQHFETFKERFKNTAVKIDYLNRFRSKAEQKQVMEDMAAGKVDIIIGTHRLIQKDVKFRDLGLLIIDEEHRFGVRQKEIIKKLKATVDVISMSATPIPRTLHFSFVGARDISVINTPPADRQSIRTYVAEFDESLIRGAILKEIRRGGQIFFVHNRVQTIESMRDRLNKLIPEARICVGHGQMKEHELEKVMVGFLQKKYDVLLSTTIIESGLDIPSANTMIVNRADTFGLSQLYQLRGRVGRSNVQAYAYLLIPDQAEVTSIASKRLAALQKYTELGSGFQIAMHDLEIRGAGNILGSEQSGHIGAVGYEFYAELLEKEIRKLKGDKEFIEIDTEIQIPVEAYLPGSYIEDNGTRIVFYKRISSLKDEAAVDEMARELEDRFGVVPEETRNLLKVIEVKIAASALGIESIQMSKGTFIYKFSEITPIAASSLLAFVKKNHDHVTLKPSSKLVITEEVASSNEVFPLIRKHLADFQLLVP
jgi:transcription-repair coupling factor (superfamily II helicase)